MSSLDTYACTGCGEEGSIVEVSLVPRAMAVVPADAGAPLGGVAYAGPETAFWESETVLGYGCENVECPYWHGQYGITRDADGTPQLLMALPLNAVAALPVAA